MRRTVRLLLAALLAAGSAADLLAQVKPGDLARVTLEDLLNIEITSASRKEQRADDTAAAVFVITRDDIRRSGMTTIPDLLRLAPGVEVAQVNSNKWAVSVRGFNDVYANKLLVLVDGRSIYNRIFAGVLWDTEDLMLDDIDRIEVIRGPGAATWGANAVNGVINIVTKPAADTQGALVRVDAGRFGEQAAVRYGGSLGAARYRLFSQWTGRDESLIAPGTRANDASQSVTTGFRADWSTSPDAFSLAGDFTAGQQRALWSNLNPLTAARAPIANDPTDTQGGHLLGRWTHTRAAGASLQVQGFVDIAGRQEPVGDYHRRTFDVDTQYHTAVGAHQDLVVGGSHRFINEEFAGRDGFSMTPAEDGANLLTAFVQHETGLFLDRLAVTLGSQVQYDSDAGVGVQPTARVMWKGLPRQRVWASTSRSLRTPSLQERGIRVDRPPVPGPGGLPLVVTALGNAAVETETFLDVEAGYRLQIAVTGSLDVTGFVGRYDHLITHETAAPVVSFVPSARILVTTRVGNQLEATTRGLEVAGHWAPVPAWRLDGSYTAFRLDPQLAAASADAAAATTDGNAPRTQWRARSTWSPGTRASIDVTIFRVGPIEGLAVDGYTRTDVSAAWQFTSRLSVTAIGQNLFDPAHAEFVGAGALLLATQVPRSAGLRVRWAWR